jgi:hypothetical protein
MFVTYVGSHDEVEVPAAGIVCKRGAVVEVPDSIGGHPPREARDAVPAQGEELLESGKKNPKYRPEQPAVEADPGSGLLAQPSNWQPATAPAEQTTEV